MTSFAFKFLDFLYLQGGYKVLEIEDSIPLSQQNNCPADGSLLKLLCVFVGQNGLSIIRYGCCDICGYCGYIDRPAKEWMTNFYLNTWKSDESMLRTDAGENIKAQQILSLLDKINVDKNRYICEIGCGYGDELKNLESAGFSKVIGIENSKHRAEIAKRAYGIEVLSDPFEDDAVQSKLRERSPFSLIFSRHVLEHVYSPQEIISKASRLQKEGDYFISILPNGLTEAPMTRLLFLPHLHSFSSDSLIRIFNNNGYQAVNDFTNAKEIILIAKKNKKIITPPNSGGNFNKILERFINDLGLRKNYLTHFQRLWWGKNLGPTQRSLYFKNKLLNKFYDRLILKITYFKFGPFKYHSCLITDANKRYTDKSESPLEIQFQDKIKLIYK